MAHLQEVVYSASKLFRDCELVIAMRWPGLLSEELVKLPKTRLLRGDMFGVNCSGEADNLRFSNKGEKSLRY